MKTFTKSLAALSLLLVMSIPLFSFTSGKGGEGFEIYIGKTLVVQKFGNQMDAVKACSLISVFQTTNWSSNTIIAAVLERTGISRSKMPKTRSLKNGNLPMIPKMELP